MRLVIHAGASKTGTSTFQAFMAERFEENREAGVLYPEAGRWLDGSHHELAFALRPLPHLVSESSAESILRAMEDEIRRACPSSVVISSELFPYLLEYDEFIQFAARNFSRITLAFVVRRQSELLFSLYNQLVKDPIQAFTGTLLECFISNIRSLNYFEIIRRWQSSPMLTDCLIRLYAPDYLPKMLGELGVPVGGASGDFSNRLNQAFPVEWLETVRAANSQLGHWRERERFVRCLAELDTIGVKCGRKVIYSHSDQRIVDDFFEQGNSELARKYLERDWLFPETEYQDIESLSDLPVSSFAALLASGIEFAASSGNS